MPVMLLCPNPKCDASFGVDESELGSAVRCKQCGTKFIAGDEASSESAAPRTQSNSPSFGPAPGDLPSTFGRYQIIRKLGQGGMGAVYLAHDDELDRDVALKVPSLSEGGNNAELLQRFQREAKAAASFHHPNFCPIHEVGKVGDRPYLAMAYVEGQTLTSRVHRDQPMQPREAAELVSTLALAMAEAHKKGILHRDLKPANVMIDVRGQPIVMDFGLARRVSGGEPELTGSNAMLGTISYMSPEQVRADKAALGPATDVYSLGVILYELVTGRRPFEGPAFAVIGQILTSEMPSASEHRPGLDANLVRIIQKATAKEIANRYRSMNEFAQALDGYLRDADGLRTHDVPPPRPSSLKSRRGGSRAWVALAAAALVAALGGVIYVTTDKGTLKIEGSEPGMVVRIDGHVTTIENVGKPITVRTGEHGLLIKRGDVVATAPEQFEIKRGRETIVRIEFIKPPPKPDDGSAEEARKKKDEDDKIAKLEAEAAEEARKKVIDDKIAKLEVAKKDAADMIAKAEAAKEAREKKDAADMVAKAEAAEEARRKKDAADMVANMIAKAEAAKEAREKKDAADMVAKAEAAEEARMKKEAAPKVAKAEAAKKAMVAANPKAAATSSFAGRAAGEGKTVKVGDVEVVLCWCPPGTFTMGSPKSERSRKGDEGPVEVRMTKGFWAMRTEVTQELFETLMGKAANQSGDDHNRPKWPVNNVTHKEAVESGVQLTKRLHALGALPADWEVRLPTEAEWEYAARAGTKTATPFGDSLSSTQANFNGNDPFGGRGPYLQKPTAVGQYPANAWGLVDTVGNVREWTSDAYEAKLHGGDDPFITGAEGSARVYRGSGYHQIAANCRVANRNSDSPESRNYSVGFRLAVVQSVPRAN